MADIRDILDINEAPGPVEIVTKESILGERSKKKTKPLREVVKRPEGMHRELYALLYTDNKDAPPLMPSDTGMYIILMQHPDPRLFVLWWFHTSRSCMALGRL